MKQYESVSWTGRYSKPSFPDFSLKIVMRHFVFFVGPDAVTDSYGVALALLKVNVSDGWRRYRWYRFWPLLTARHVDG